MISLIIQNKTRHPIDITFVLEQIPFTFISDFSLNPPLNFSCLWIPSYSNNFSHSKPFALLTQCSSAIPQIAVIAVVYPLIFVIIYIVLSAFWVNYAYCCEHRYRHYLDTAWFCWTICAEVVLNYVTLSSLPFVYNLLLTFYVNKGFWLWILWRMQIFVRDFIFIIVWKRFLIITVFLFPLNNIIQLETLPTIRPINLHIINFLNF